MMSAQVEMQPNRETIERHILKITSRWNELDEPPILELRLLAENRTPNVARFDVSDDFFRKEAIDHIEAMNKTGLNAYAVINPVNPNRAQAGKFATDADIIASFYNWIDCDEEQATENARNFVGPKRSYTVLTGTIPHNRPHLYWELEKPCYDMTEWRKQQVAMAAKFRSDGVVVNPSRIMRIAGTITFPSKDKINRGYVSEVTAFPTTDFGAPVPFERMRALFPDGAQPSPGSSDTSGDFQFDAGEQSMDRAMAAANIDAGEDWHNNVIRLVASYVAKGLTDGEIHAITDGFTQPPYTVDQTRAEVQKSIDGAREKGFAPEPQALRDSFDHKPADEAETPVWRVQTAADFIADFVAPEYLIEGVAQRGRLYTLTAPTGTGKTAAMLYGAVSIATGEPFCGLDVERGSVLFLAGENPDDVRARVIATLDHYEIAASECDLHVIAGTFSIRQDMEALKQAAARLPGLALIVVDTFAAYFDGEDENSNAQALDFTHVVRKLTELPSRPSVIMPAHPVKNAAKNNLSPKGGSSVLNEVDGNLTLWKEGDIVSLHWQGKHRGPDFDPLKLELHKVENAKIHDKHGRIMPSVVAGPISELRAVELAAETLSREDKILLSIGSHPAISIIERCTQVGLVGENGNAQKSSMHRALERLVKQKLIKRFRSNWELTSEGGRAVEMLHEGLPFSQELD